MAKFQLVQETPWNHHGRRCVNLFRNHHWRGPKGLNLDIDGWLRRIGLEQYAQTFRDNAIDADVLRDLTDDHSASLACRWGRGSSY
jgi:hypothetical protein